METPHRTDISLELSDARAADRIVRQKVEDICVSQFGIPSGDAARLFEHEAPFLVSTQKSEGDLNRVIAELAELGVLARPSKGPRRQSQEAPCLSPTRRAALYSSQYGDLLNTQKQKNTYHILSAKRDSRGRAPAKMLTLGILVALFSIGVPSARLFTTKFNSSSWSRDDFHPSSSASGALIPPYGGDLSSTFRGSASISGVRLACQVSKSGNTYSARFAGGSLEATPTQIRIEGEPTFLAPLGETHSATTTYTITEPLGIFRTGDALIEILLNDAQTPRQARITLELPRDIRKANSSAPEPITFLIDLSSR